MHPVLPRVLRTCALGAALLLAAAGAARPLPGEPPPLRVTRMDAPARAVVTDAAGAWVATFTDG
ncbi:MAG: superoxide dismutase family protein, partial [Gemmatimonadetes bacterium]|nr:superoxide dismutase family protein [Gemmatimonadota bacterium]